MDYAFDNLGPDRFQEFCQALVAREHPNLQCFPVGQADGGRDAVAVLDDSQHLIVYQMKFVRNSLAERDPHKWITAVASEELPKIQHLTARGLKRYVLMTNVRGTAVLDSGSIDQTASVLSGVAGVQAQCWWRDDLARRLDAHPQLRWAYPELATAADLLKQYLDSYISEDRERRFTAIKAFITDQYSIDRQVKFKQVELHNNLLDLFVDVSVGPPTCHGEKRQRELHMAFRGIAVQFREREASFVERFSPDDAIVEYRESSHRGDSVTVGAATLFLNPAAQEHMPLAVLEGAPGQGKSTITQYVCQVHRMRLLNELPALAAIPDHHRRTPVRVPFKIDLRDFATWLSKKDPFTPTESDSQPQFWQRSLEAFMAAQVRHHSGGIAFDVADLHAVARGSALLIVCDGLDEIADITRRQDVIDEISRGVGRLSRTSLSLQAIVTSRPVAFANAPAFADERYTHFHLTSLPRQLIDEYCNKWLAARDVQPREQIAVRNILRDKLDQPHLRDLARNPMQLAILLTLIHTRGASLPDKRTALYDSYIELFFSREAEKSNVVRDHRDLLIDLHRYLAWVLHTAAEQGQSSGSISDERLRSLLKDYLSGEGRPTGLADVLFTGMVERVVALVSRVQGTFEFEVQPLREYFAARFLYETAPYSPPGAEQKGTKPDRFAVIARNFYWLNVTRFYAGCYSKGELPSLVDGLRELASAPEYSQLPHPRVLTATLLGDWVFSQHQRSVRDAFRLMVEGDGLRNLVAGMDRRSQVLTLADGCGRSELVGHAFDSLQTNSHSDYTHALCSLIRQNADLLERSERWHSIVSGCSGRERSRWLNYGEWLGTLEEQKPPVLEALLQDEEITPWRVNVLHRAGHSEFLQSSDTTLAPLIDAVLDGMVLLRRARGRTMVDMFALAHSSERYLAAMEHPQLIPLSEFWGVRNQAEPLNDSANPVPAGSRFAEGIWGVVSTAIQQSARPSSEWATSIEPWNEIVELSRKVFGDRWVHFELACAAAGVKSKSETCTDASQLFDSSVGLCRRARYARLRSGNVSWWSEQLGQAADDQRRLFAALLLVTWAKPSTLIHQLEVLEHLVSEMNSRHWNRLYWACRRISRGRRSTVRLQMIEDTELLPEKLNHRAAALLGTRSSDTASVYNRYLRNYEGHDTEVWSFCQSAAVTLAVKSLDNWDNALNVIRLVYEHGVSYLDAHPPYHRAARFLPLDAAETICGQPNAFPLEILGQAQSSKKVAIGEGLIPVAKVAEKEGWFEHLLAK